MPRLDYFAPGVYVEEIDRGSRPIDGVQTNIAGFIGFTEAVQGGAEIGKPMLITSWNQYLEYFAKDGSTGFAKFVDGNNRTYYPYLPFAVNGWFLNGGARCWVVSLGTQLPQPARDTPLPSPAATALTITTTAKRKSLQFALKPDEVPHGTVMVEILPDEPIPPEEAENVEIPEDAPDIDPDAPLPVSAEFFRIVIKRDGQELEDPYRHLTMDRNIHPTFGTYVSIALSQSRIIDVIDLTTEEQQREQRPEERAGRLPIARRPMSGSYAVAPPVVLPTRENLYRSVQGGRDGGTGIQGLYEIDEITMIACPDLMLVREANIIDDEQMHGIMELMVSLCENASPNPPNRMVVLDPPRDRVKPQQIATWLQRDFNRRSMFAALYYPWIKVPNPANEGKPVAVPPCGHMLGVWSRVDETRGVYKAPANEVPRGVLGLTYNCNFREQELLNPIGINCIRTFPNRGIRIWGARTLVEPDKTEWRYISVRRLISYIEKSIELGTQWVVFEPNDQDLWARVRRTVSNFLERIWREGALFGATPEQAFYVKCDESINTSETMILGRLYIEVGICPVRPAEFVVFRVSQWTGKDEE